MKTRCHLSALLVTAISLLPFRPQAQTISTLAGKKQSGYSGDGGPASASLLYKATCVVTDKAGNLFVSDFCNHVVRKIDRQGIITTIAGNHIMGYSGDGGPATAAQMKCPWGLAIDATGNLYIAEKENNIIRKINTEGIISTIAGNGTQGYSGNGGAATAAQLNHPLGVAVDKAGNVYVADNSNNVVRKINPAGLINTIAGNHSAGNSGDGGQATAASFRNPRHVAVDEAGNVFVSDTWNSVVRKIAATGIITTVAGNRSKSYTGDGGQATAAGIYYPVGITVGADGCLYIADNHNHAIRKVDNNGIITTVAGNGVKGYSGDNGPATTAQIANPTSITIDETGKLYIAEFENNLVRVVNLPSFASYGHIKIYPNPTQNSITMELPEYTANPTVYISDVTGKVLETKALETSKPQRVSFNLAGLAAAAYIINVTAAGKTYSERVVKL